MADSAASHTEPSLISPSPVTTKTRASAPRMRKPHRAPDADRQAVAERAGRGLDAGHLAGLGMPAEDRIAAAERSSTSSGKNPFSASITYCAMQP